MTGVCTPLMNRLKRFRSSDPSSVSSKLRRTNSTPRTMLPRELALDADVHVDAVLHRILVRVEVARRLTELNVPHGEIVGVGRRELRLHAPRSARCRSA